MCVVGLGSIGRRHVNVLKKKGIANLIGVDPRKDRQEQAKKETQIDSVSDDFRMVLKIKTSTQFLLLYRLLITRP